MDEQTPIAAVGSPGPALALFAKAPRPGLAKTRLCPPLRPAEAAGLYRGFLSSALRPLVGVRTVCYVWPEDAVDELAALAAPGVEFRPQRGANLFERMQACFDELFAAGHDRVALRGTDSPDVAEADLAAAVASCAPGRVVLGPDAGGGYWLVGLAAPCPELFTGPDPGRFEAVGATARRLGLEVAPAARARDVDTWDDLVALLDERGRGRPDDGRISSR